MTWGKGTSLSDGWKSTLRRPWHSGARPAKGAIPELWTGGRLSDGQASMVFKSIGQKGKV